MDDLDTNGILILYFELMRKIIYTIDQWPSEQSVLYLRKSKQNIKFDYFCYWVERFVNYLLKARYALISFSNKLKFESRKFWFNWFSSSFSLIYTMYHMCTDIDYNKCQSSCITEQMNIPMQIYLKIIQKKKVR